VRVSGTTHGLVLTGERTLPGIWHERYWFTRHLVTYELAVRATRDHGSSRDRSVGAAGPRVLDAGCGEGYGAALLASSPGAQVVGLDHDAATTLHVRAAYPGVAAVRGNLVGLPLLSASFDAAVSLQTVEHVWDQAAFAAECARVLCPGGLLVVSTPNRLTFSPGAHNPFHARELDAGELHDLLRPYLPDLQLLGVHHGRRLLAFEESYGDPVAAQLATSPVQWDSSLAQLVASVAPADFEIVADCPGRRLDDALDLVAVGTVPARGPAA